MTRRTLLLLLLVALSAACTWAEQDFSVVVQSGNPAKSITKAQLRRMMMGELGSWPGGAQVVVLMGPAGNSARGIALRKICGMTESDFSKHSLQASFDGRGGGIPKSLPSDAVVRQIVLLTPGSVGIVGEGDPGAGLKVIPVE
jgi:hypothetical protein